MFDLFLTLQHFFFPRGFSIYVAWKTAMKRSKLSNKALYLTLENWTPEVLTRLLSRPSQKHTWNAWRLKIVYESLRTKCNVFVAVLRESSSKWSVSLLFSFLRIEKSCFLAYMKHVLVLCRQNASRQLATSSENLVASAQFLVALATSESQFRALRTGLTLSKTVYSRFPPLSVCFQPLYYKFVTFSQAHHNPASQLFLLPPMSLMHPILLGPCPCQSICNLSAHDILVHSLWGLRNK